MKASCELRRQYKFQGILVVSKAHFRHQSRLFAHHAGRPLRERDYCMARVSEAWNSLSIALERNIARNKTRASLAVITLEIKYLWFVLLRVDIR